MTLVQFLHSRFIIIFLTDIFVSDAGNQKLIKITRDPSQSFGISIVGGKVNVTEDVWISGIFIKDVIPNSPADLSKQLKVSFSYLYTQSM